MLMLILQVGLRAEQTVNNMHETGIEACFIYLIFNVNIGI